MGSGDVERKKVAVIGSGLAGLVTAFLLHHDPQQRYEVEVYEKGPQASLDAASISVDQRVDVPMRALTPGYYPSLVALYHYLGIRIRAQCMRFAFSKDIGYDNADFASCRTQSTYFIHASNLHVFPPARPQQSSRVAFMIELLFVGACYLYFTIACYLLQAQCDESLDEYLTRIRIPQRFAAWYILPLLSAVSTCSHEEILRFPAADLVEYRRKLIGKHHYVAVNGVQEVQAKLLDGIAIHCNCAVESISLDGKCKEVTWQEVGSGTLTKKTFDEVVMAVSPDIAARLFEPARTQLSQVKTVSVTTIVHSDVSFHQDEPSLKQHCQPSSSSSSHTQTVLLHTSAENPRHTEATHIQGSVMVTSSPLRSVQKSKVLAEHHFRRVVRDSKGRRVTRALLRLDDTSRRQRVDTKWRNGDMGVWVAGAWCWDGMVLLEGCMVSAMAIAKSLGVDIPWQQPHKDHESRKQCM